LQEKAQHQGSDNGAQPAGVMTPQFAEAFWEEGAWDVQETEEDPQADAKFERIMNPVVRLYCRHTDPNFSLPWQRERECSSSSTGFAVQGPTAADRWLLTNAHAVEYCSQARRPNCVIYCCHHNGFLLVIVYNCTTWGSSPPPQLHHSL
jgi:hypothetical protein